ncbi:Uncharacterised protein [Orientia tsutsugamushi]|uniref:Uncharacterized protein n=1 Tax=Orientia tsutsugamushi TaxID=784 RepID=A0A2U3RS93_ORITS|nr:hypothetical protein OTSKARP_1019 [Orientia tsutsugamushi str. Karp]SPR16093.1 Uncharacterised protein [Orientia tsutsugamushi]
MSIATKSLYLRSIKTCFFQQKVSELPAIFDIFEGKNGAKITNNNSSNNATIFYNFIGNIIPPEWKNLTEDNGKALSKTSKQLLSFIVFRLQIYYNKDIDELQESYHLFDDKLDVG